MNGDKDIHEIEILAKIVAWEWNSSGNTLYLSNSIKQLFSLPDNFVFNYRRFIKSVCQEDRAFVHSIFSGLPDMHFFPQFYLSIYHQEEIRHLFVKGQATVGSDGSVITIKGILQDVTDLRNALQQIDSQNERFKDISWMQSHVLRAPVATIMGLLDLLQDDELSGEQLPIISRLKNAASSLDTIIREMSTKSEVSSSYHKPL